MADRFPIQVTVIGRNGEQILQYVMDHNDRAQCKVLGEQCRNAFVGGQEIRTKPVLRMSRVY